MDIWLNRKTFYRKIDRDATFKEQVSNVYRESLSTSILKWLSFRLNTNVTMPALHSFIKWHIQYRSKRGMSFLEKLQEWSLRFVYNNYTTPYVDLLRKAHIPSVSAAWQRSAVIEVYKVLNGLSPKYMQCMFTLNKTNHNLCSDNKILLPKYHTTKFGFKSFAYQAGSFWNTLSNSFKTWEWLTDFNTKILIWSIDMWYTFYLAF